MQPVVSDPTALCASISNAVKYPVSKDVIEKLLAAGKEVHYPAKSTILAAGALQTHFFIITKGIQRAYFTHSGKETTMYFTVAGQFSCVPDSFLRQIPSDNTVEAITDSQLIKIPQRKILEMVAQDRGMETLFRRYTEEVLIEFCRHQSTLLRTTLEERFSKFLSEQPKMLHTIPHKYLASYLRIDPTNFSKLLNSVKI